MDTAQFRRGNLVFYKDNEFAVEEVYSDSLTLKKRMVLAPWIPAAEIQPIPITPVGLRTLGFKLDREDNYEIRYVLYVPSEYEDGEVLKDFKEGYYYLSYSKTYNNYRFFFDGVYILPCEFIHHIMNAFFCLSGTEITDVKTE